LARRLNVMPYPTAVAQGVKHCAVRDIAFMPAFDPPPRPPTEPDAAECCGEGCARCVFDVYEVALDSYRSALALWQARQTLDPGAADSATGSAAAAAETKSES